MRSSSQPTASTSANQSPSNNPRAALPPLQSQPTNSLDDISEDESLNEMVVRDQILKKLYLIEQSPEPNPFRRRDATCRACKFEIPKMKVDRLIKHSTKCRLSEKVVVNRLIEANRAFETAAKRTLSGTEKNVSKDAKDQTDIAIVDFVAASQQSLRIVESKELKHLLSLLNKGYRIPSRKKLTLQLLPQRASLCRSADFERLKSCPVYSLTLEFDSWLSSAGVSILAFTVTAPTGFSVLIDLVDISAVYKDATMHAKAAVKAILESGIPKKMFNCVVSDEASACKLARKMIVEHVSPHLVEYRCVAHVCNLIEGLLSKHPLIEDALKKLSRFLNIVLNHKKLLLKLRNRQENRPILVASTRWFTIYGSVNSVLQLHEALEHISVEANYDSSKWRHYLNDADFWRVLADAKPYFARLSKVIALSEASNLKLSSSIDGLLEYGKFVLDLDEQVPFEHAAIQAYITHFHKLNVMLVLTAYALDPRYKLLYLTRLALKEIKTFIMKLLLDMGKPSSVAPVMIKEFSTYMSLAKDVQDKIDLTEWWSKSELVYLGIIGRTISSWHASSANTERMFSSLNRMVTSDRNRLSLDTIFDSIAVNIHCRAENKQRASIQEIVASQDAEVDSVGESFLESSLLCTETLEECDVFPTRPLAKFDQNLADTINMRPYRQYIDYFERPLDAVEAFASPTRELDISDTFSRASYLIERHDP